MSLKSVKMEPSWFLLVFFFVFALLLSTLGFVPNAYAAEEKSIKILSICNSRFDGMDFNKGQSSHLFEFLREAGYTDITLGVLDHYSGVLSDHWNDANNENVKYVWQKLASQTSSGTWTSTQNIRNITMLEGLTEEPWDVIILQQSNLYAHSEGGYACLGDLVLYIKSHNPDARLGWQMTWANGLQSDVPVGSEVGIHLRATPAEQLTMYNSITAAVQNKVNVISDIDFVIPSGIVIQNMRDYGVPGAKLIKDNLSSLSNGLGRYAVSMTWLKAITGESVDNLTYRPLDVSETEQNYVKHAINSALTQYAITFHSNGGQGGPADFSVPYSNELTQLPEPEPTREDYDFLGWAESIDATEPQYYGGQNIGEMPLRRNLYLYAVWRPVTPPVVDDPISSGDGNLIPNGDFEAFIPFENFSRGGNNTFTVETRPEYVYEGNAALRIQQNTRNAFAGFYLVLEPGCVYEYEYWIKVLHDIDGNPVSNINATTNFVFFDPLAHNGQNHFPYAGSVPLSTGGEWTHVTGTWTANPNMDPAATPEEAWFSIYMDASGPVPDGKFMIYVLDKVSLVRQGENENLISNGSFELPNPFENFSRGGGNTFTIDTAHSAGGGKSALTVQQDTLNAFAGFPFAIEPGCTYAFEYQIKVISDSAGNPVSNINATTNFVFYEPGAHDSQNHFSGSVPLSTGEDWKLVSGSWTASSNMNPGATPEEAWFAIYMDHFQGRSMIYAIDNVKLIKKTHTVTYNYGANGGAEPGTGNATAQKTYNNGALVEMPATADKDNNWQFVGWNRDRNAREGEDPFQVAQNVELFAIYKKEFTVTLIDYTSSAPTTPPREVTETIYGGTTATVTIPAPNSYNPYTGWTSRGWCYAGSMAPNAEVAVEPGELIIDKDETLYALYQLVYTVHYDTQGDPIIPDDTTTRYANSYDISNTVREDIILPADVVRQDSTFDRWRSTFSGYTFLPGAPFPPSAVYTTLEALWIETPAPVQSFDLPESNLISDNMLIQRDKPIHLWGTSTAAESLTITASIRNGQEILSTGTTTVAPGAAFRLTLPPLTEGGPYVLEIKDNKGYTQTISNVLIGELWHFSGQSNMVRTVGQTHPESVPASNIEAIRYFSVGPGGIGAWKVATPADVPSFSAVAYTALAKMKDGLSNVPVGGICTAMGNQKMAAYQGESTDYPIGGPLYNERVRPLTNLSIRGHMWYQGESDATNSNFAADFETLIHSWRTAWNDNQQPFIFVQLPQSPALGAADSGMRNFTNARNWQLEVYNKLAESHVGMVVSVDTNRNTTLTGSDPLHPLNKKPIGESLGLYALGAVYGQSVSYLSPMYESMSISGSQVTVTFKNVHGGLSTNDSLAPKNFMVAGNDGVFHDADSVVISGTNQLVISSSSVANPFRVAYFRETAWTNGPFEGKPVNLVNSAGLPASPFVADKFDPSLYDELDWRDPSRGLLGTWGANTNGGSLPGSSTESIASRVFNAAELPVGSIIDIDVPYAYRPERWAGNATVSGIPFIKATTATAAERVLVDETWWDGCEKRAFTIIAENYHKALVGIEEEAASHFHIYVPKEAPPEEKSIKILSITNSRFDGLDFNKGQGSHLLEFLREAGYTDITLGVLDHYSGVLSDHWDDTNKTRYVWQFLSTQETAGVWKSSEGVKNITMQEGLTAEPWDVIVLQQSNLYAHGEGGYDCLGDLVEYVKAHITNPDARLGWQMTWANGLWDDVPAGTDVGIHLRATPAEQLVMYNRIIATVKNKVEVMPDIDFIIPSGVVIQNMRDYGVPGSRLIKDNASSLSNGLGRYAVSMTWLKAITGESVDNLTYRPLDVSGDEQNYVKQAVNAVSNQYTITYNGTANGGSPASRLQETAYLNQVIDLTQPAAPTAAPPAGKEGWVFAGWNTDPRAEGVLDSWRVTSDKELYAIYKKELTATFISHNGYMKIVTEKKGAIYKESTAASVEVPPFSPYQGWYAKGWVSGPDDSSGGLNPQIPTLFITEDRTFYGLYERQVTLDFNVNGGNPERDSVSCPQVVNSSNVSKTWGGQTFLLPESINKAGMAFDGWALYRKDGTKYQPGWAFIDLQDTARATMYATWDDGQSIKILAIGNSFSLDGMDYNLNGGSQLFNLLQEEGYTDITLGVLEIPGSSLQTHLTNAANNSSGYGYYKLESQISPAVWTSKGASTMQAGIKDEDWDVIILQQVSGSSHVESSYDPLNSLLGYINTWKNPNTRLGWQMTWAYGLTTDVPGGGGTLKATHEEQFAMYNGIIDAVKARIVINPAFDFIIPSGVSIQEMRGYGVSGLIRDNGSHLSFGLGRYIAGMTWLKAITGKSVDDITYKPVGVSESDQKLVKKAVNEAWLKGATWKPDFEDSVEYLAVHKTDTPPVKEYYADFYDGTIKHNDRYPNHYDINRWYVEEPASFTRGWDQILATVGTRGTPDRRLAVAHTFSYFRHDMVKTKASIWNMMQTAEELEIPIFIHLDGAMYWKGAGLWNWFDDSRDDYDENNKYNVERYDWGIESAVKIGWRDWSGNMSDIHRVEYGGPGDPAAPAPNLASQAFRDANAAALDEIMTEIMIWYNRLPSDKKYLLGGVVLGMEATPYMNAFYVTNQAQNGLNLSMGNELWNQDPGEKCLYDKEKFTQYNMTQGRKLGYAAAQSMKERYPGIQTEGKITDETIDLILYDYFKFLIEETLKSGIAPNKLITHAYPPACPSEKGFYTDHNMKATMSIVDGVVPGWSARLNNYDVRVELDKLAGRPWAAIETTYWLFESPDFNDVYLANKLNEVFNHGNCRHVSLKDWEFPLSSNTFSKAIRTTLNQ
ncbi:MAG: DUF4886 domain-containing protein [Peptococcaceae bacterium]|nr:DUF4886 domain-containing protein [Peptococcaceae bacterium]